jgi:serine/threonine protein kinase
LADFGFSKEFSSQSIGFTSKGWGTNGYMAPEFLLPGGDNIAYNRKADIWSLGCILYELAVGRQLFEDNYYVLRYKETGIRPEITFEELYCDDDKERIRDAFNRMLTLDSRARPEAGNLVKEFSSNYASTTSAPPQSIQIYEEFSTTRLTTMMAHTELNTTHERIVVSTSDQEVQLPVDFEERTQERIVVTTSDQKVQLLFAFEERKSLVLSEIEKDPSSFWPWHALSTLLASDSDDIEEAITACEKAITACEEELERSPGMPSIMMELINLYAVQGNYVKAVKYSLEVVKMDPGVVLNALSSPKSHLIRSIISDLEEKESSLELYGPETWLAD